MQISLFYETLTVLRIYIYTSYVVYCILELRKNLKFFTTKAFGFKGLDYQGSTVI